MPARLFIFHPHAIFLHFLLPLSFFFLLFFHICAHRLTSMDPRKSTQAKRQWSGSTSLAAPPPPEDPHRFVSREAERIYHESLFNCSFVLECGFPTSNAFFNFTIKNRIWQTLCAPPVSGVALVVREFHSNMPFKVGITVFVRGKWVEFGAQAINRIYYLMDDDSVEYRALFADIDYERLM